MSIGYIMILIFGLLIYYILHEITKSAFSREDRMRKLLINQSEPNKKVSANFYTSEFIDYYNSVYNTNFQKLNNLNEYKVVDFLINHIELNNINQNEMSYNLN